MSTSQAPVVAHRRGRWNRNRPRDCHFESGGGSCSCGNELSNPNIHEMQASSLPIADYYKPIGPLDSQDAASCDSPGDLHATPGAVGLAINNGNQDEAADSDATDATQVYVVEYERKRTIILLTWQRVAMLSLQRHSTDYSAAMSLVWLRLALLSLHRQYAHSTWGSWQQGSKLSWKKCGMVHGLRNQVDNLNNDNNEWKRKCNNLVRTGESRAESISRLQRELVFRQEQYRCLESKNQALVRDIDILQQEFIEIVTNYEKEAAAKRAEYTDLKLNYDAVLEDATLIQHDYDTVSAAGRRSPCGGRGVLAQSFLGFCALGDLPAAQGRVAGPLV